MYINLWLYFVPENGKFINIQFKIISEIIIKKLTIFITIFTPTE